MKFARLASSIAVALTLAACGGSASAPASSSTSGGSAAPASKPAAPAATSAPASASAKPSAASPNASAAVSAKSSASPSGPLKHLKVGTLPTIGNAPFYIAEAKGYFKDEGIEVEIVNFSAGSQTIPALAAGQIDAANSVTPSAGLINAAATGLPVRIVADDGTIHKDRNIANIMVRKDLQPNAGQYIDFGSLKNPIRAAASAVDLVPDAILKLQLEKAGVKAAGEQFNYLGLPDINVAFKNKNLDIAASGEPLITIGVQQGLYTRWKPMADLYPNMPYSNLLYGPNLREKDKDAGNRLLRAYLRGVRDYEDALSKGKDLPGIVKIIGPPLKITPELFKAVQDQGGLAYFDPDGKVSIDALQPIVDFWIKQGAVKQKSFDVKTLVDSSFAQAAVQKLGAYK